MMHKKLTSTKVQLLQGESLNDQFAANGVSVECEINNLALPDIFVNMSGPRHPYAEQDVPEPSAPMPNVADEDDGGVAGLPDDTEPGDLE